MHKNYAFDADKKPILYVDPRDAQAQEEEEEKEGDEHEELDHDEVIEQASDILVRIMVWETEPVAEVRMTLNNLTWAKRAVFLLNMRPDILGLQDVSLSGLARLTGIPKQKLALLNDDFTLHFQQPSHHSKKKSNKQPHLILPPIDDTVQLDLFTSEEIED